MDSEDGRVLFVLYDKTGGREWRNREGWCVRTKPLSSQWYGVQANNQRRVLKLLLDNNKLEGSIPPELGKLEALVHLSLKGNRLTGLIPPELGKIEALVHLSLKGNRLAGPIPPELGRLEALVHLSLEGNRLTGPVSSSLGNLKVLQHLSLAWNQLSGRIPSELGNIVTLIHLHLHNNQLSGPIPPELGKLKALVHLSLEGNDLTGAIPPELGKLEALVHLSLEGNGLTGRIPSSLGNLKVLQHLSLAWNQLAGRISSGLGHIVTLVYLQLHNNHLSGLIPPELGNLEALVHLSLEANGLTGPIPPELGKLEALVHLSLERNDLTGSVPAQLVNLVSLKNLRLYGNKLCGPLPSSSQLTELYGALGSPDRGHEVTGWATIPLIGWPLTKESTAGVTLKGTSGATAEMMAGVTLKEPAGTAVKITETEGGITEDMADGMTESTETAEGITEEVPEEMPDITPNVSAMRTRFEVAKRMRRTVAERTADLDGEVLAWSLGSGTGTIGSPDFELEVPLLAKTIPALVGQSSSVAGIVDGKRCLLHPVVTCLAQKGISFSCPLLLRFPVGDLESMGSGSDSGEDEIEDNYRIYLKKRFSPMRREEGSSEWVPIEGHILQTKKGVFVLEVKVSHFTQYALKHDVEAGKGQAVPLQIKKLRHETRQNVFMFVNQGNIPITVYYWPLSPRRNFVSSAQGSITALFGGMSGGFERQRQGPSTEVYCKNVAPIPFSHTAAGATPTGKSATFGILPDTEYIRVAWTTQEINGDGRVVRVWGVDALKHKHAMVYGPLPENDQMTLTLGNGVYTGEEIKRKVG